jgi:hypothetical protein
MEPPWLQVSHDAAASDKFWYDISSTITARAVSEGWTRDDCVAAQMQTRLLSYTSNCDDCYYPSTPQYIMHNAPWNDWVPPSKRFKHVEQAADSQKIQPALNRVCARLCSSEASTDGESLRISLHNSKIVFAHVERSSDGTRFLRLLRGSEVLASMDVSFLQIVQANNRAVALMPRLGSEHACPVLFLVFQNSARVANFDRMLM